MIGFIGLNANVYPLNVISLKCILMKNLEFKAGPAVMNIYSNEPLLYPYSVLINKSSGSCNNINDPYFNLCVFDVVENMNVKVFTLISRTDETRHMPWHEACEYKCRLDASSVCNDK